MEDQKQIEIPSEFEEIGKVVDQYKNVICQKFRTEQAALLHQLQEKAKQLRQNILFYKKQTSKEAIQKLVFKKRHQKQAQRQQLQLKWRNLMQKYKKLQDEQKKINQQNRQSLFDLQNLRNKIQQLKGQNKDLDKKIKQIQQKVTITPFLTEAKVQSYSSPYKISPQRIARSLERRSTNLSKQSHKMKGSIIRLNKNQSNQHDKENLDNSQCYPKQSKIVLSRFGQKNQTQNGQGHERKFKALFNSQKNYFDKSASPSFKKNQKWQQLKYYLEKPQIRDKIFQLLRK